MDRSKSLCIGSSFRAEQLHISRQRVRLEERTTLQPGYQIYSVKFEKIVQLTGATRGDEMMAAISSSRYTFCQEINFYRMVLGRCTLVGKQCLLAVLTRR